MEGAWTDASTKSDPGWKSLMFPVAPTPRPEARPSVFVLAGRILGRSRSNSTRWRATRRASGSIPNGRQSCWVTGSARSATRSRGDALQASANRITSFARGSSSPFSQRRTCDGTTPSSMATRLRPLAPTAHSDFFHPRSDGSLEGGFVIARLSIMTVAVLHDSPFWSAFTSRQRPRSPGIHNRHRSCPQLRSEHPNCVHRGALGRERGGS